MILYNPFPRLLFRFLSVCSLLLVGKTFSWAQSNLGHTPVSRFGYGVPVEWGIARNEAMAGVGVASPHPDFTNLINPALIAYNEKVQLNFDLRYRYRILNDATGPSFSSGSGSPVLVSLTVPISKAITSSLGIRPYSFRDFLYTQKSFSGTDSLQFRTRGSGGLTSIFFSNALKIGSNLSLGLEASYLFGTLQDSVTFGALPTTSNFSFFSIHKRRVSQIQVKPGLHLRMPLPKWDNTYLSVGATADIGEALNYRSYRYFAIKGAGAQRDTIDEGSRQKLNRPLTYSGGFCLFSPGKGSVSVEYDYTTYSGNASENQRVQNVAGSAVRLGGEYTIGTRKSTKYLNIMTFRAGLAYSQFPLKEAGNHFSDRRMSVGASFPIIRKEAKFSRTAINLGLIFGQFGEKNSSIGQETYWQVSLGFTMNDFLWFNRYRID